MTYSIKDFISLKQIPNQRLEKILVLLIEEIDVNYVDNIYITTTKCFPPEVLKIEIAPIADDTDKDDSTSVYWRFVHPEIYETVKNLRD